MQDHPSNGRLRSGRGTALRIGVAGHRALPGADPARLGTVFVDILRTRVDPRVVGGRPLAPSEMVCVSSLAEGADTILAEAALASGLALAAPLPFPRAVYALDFAPGPARDRYDRLLARATTVWDDAHDLARDEAYEAAGRLLLEHSDTIVALWDGRPERGRGGTGQLVREALARALPVTIIAAAAPHAVRTLPSPPARPQPAARN